LGNANLDNLRSLVDLGKASPTAERTEYHFCKPREIFESSFFLFCTMTNKSKIISQIITLHVLTLSCHPQGACNQHLVTQVFQMQLLVT